MCVWLCDISVYHICGIDLFYIPYCPSQPQPRVLSSCGLRQSRRPPLCTPHHGCRHPLAHSLSSCAALTCELWVDRYGRVMGVMGVSIVSHLSAYASTLSAAYLHMSHSHTQRTWCGCQDWSANQPSIYWLKYIHVGKINGNKLSYCQSNSYPRCGAGNSLQPCQRAAQGVLAASGS